MRAYRSSTPGMVSRDPGKRTARAPAVVFALALLVRILWIAASADGLKSDELDYHNLAASLVQSCSYEQNGAPTAYRPPGYPFFLWAVYSVAGIRHVAPLVLQALLDALLALLLYVWLSRSHPRAAVLAGVFWALFPAAVLFSGLLLSETLFTAVMFASILTLDRTQASATAVFSGLLLGFACLIKPWAIVFAALLALVGLARRDPDRRMALACLAALLTLLPWMVRNELAMGFFGISTNTGMNLYVGNNPRATGGYQGTFPQEIISASGNERRLDSVSTHLATEYVLGEPLRFVQNAVRKTARLLASEGELLVFALSNDGPGRSYRERHAELPASAKVLVNAPSLLVLLLGSLGLIAAGKSFGKTSTLLLVGTIVLTTAVFFGSSRFRFPATPFLVMFGAIAATSLPSTLRGLSFTRKMLLVAAIALVASAWIAESILLANA